MLKALDRELKFLGHILIEKRLGKCDTHRKYYSQKRETGKEHMAYQTSLWKLYNKMKNVNFHTVISTYKGDGKKNNLNEFG